MDQNQLDQELAGLNLGGIRFFDSVSSTNEEAARWIEQGASHLALVVAGEQTSGRGRRGRTWYSPRGASLSASLILKPAVKDAQVMPRLTALGALAVCDALQKGYSLPAQIKWPNDVLVSGKKVAGVLAEAHWSGEELSAAILGLGVNLGRAAVDQVRMARTSLPFPAAALEEFLDRPVKPVELLHSILSALLARLPRLGSLEFIQAWETRLAYKGEWVQVFQGEGSGKDGLPQSLEGLPASQEGKVLGLNGDGSLRLQTRQGEKISVHVGEVRLRPLE
jgi:BirA family transcriptional regulator, biotin operon repressor / biotin---[acetyl-CoA-carboxylase] ligase